MHDWQLDRLGLMEHMLNFKIEPLGMRRYRVLASKGRYAKPAVYDIDLGEHTCLGCSPGWEPFGCPVHDPRSSWPIRRALREYAGLTGSIPNESSPHAMTWGDPDDDYDPR